MRLKRKNKITNFQNTCIFYLTTYNISISHLTTGHTNTVKSFPKAIFLSTEQIFNQLFKLLQLHKWNEVLPIHIQKHQEIV